jgi:hypothetical protein
VYYFYALDGRRLGKYTVPEYFTVVQNRRTLGVLQGGRCRGREANLTGSVYVSFLSMLTNRVGSVRVGTTAPLNYFPYGEERTSTPNGWRSSAHTGGLQ